MERVSGQGKRVACVPTLQGVGMEVAGASETWRASKKLHASRCRRPLLSKSPSGESQNSEFDHEDWRQMAERKESLKITGKWENIRMSVVTHGRVSKYIMRCVWSLAHGDTGGRWQWCSKLSFVLNKLNGTCDRSVLQHDTLPVQSRRLPRKYFFNLCR